MSSISKKLPSIDTKLITDSGNMSQVYHRFFRMITDQDLTLPGENGLLVNTSGTLSAVSVTGTINKITVTNGSGVLGAPTIDISNSYVGQTSLTTLGTVTTGTWNATKIDVPYGGTNLTSCSQGDLLYGSSFNVYSALTKDTNATRYLSNQGTNNNPSWGQVGLTDGVTGVLPVANGGTNASSASITAFNNITGYTASGATGTTSTNLVFSTSPTLVTPILGTPTSGTLTNCTGLPVAGGGTGLSSATAYAVLCGGTTGTGAFQSIASVGTSGQVLTSNGAGNLPTFQTAGTQVCINRVSTQTGAAATGTTTLPGDDTIPQNTEGDQYMTLSITPANTANKLVIDVRVCASSSAGAGYFTCALFQDTTAGALASQVITNTATLYMHQFSFNHIMTAGTTSATTFKVRVGHSAAGTTTFNGQSGARFDGGVMASSINIVEYSV